MNDWYRRSMPNRRVTLFFFALVVGIDVCCLGLYLALRSAYGPAAASNSAHIFPMISGIICLGASAILGIMRAERFPALKTEHADFLAGSPWTQATRTPFGPWRPVIYDVPVQTLLGLLTALHLGGSLWLTAPQLQEVQSALPYLIALLTILPTVFFFGGWATLGYIKVLPDWRRAVAVPLLVFGIWLHFAFYGTPIVFITFGALMVILGCVSVFYRMKSVLGLIPQRVQSVTDPDPRTRVPNSTRQLLPTGAESQATQILDGISKDPILCSVTLGTWVAIADWQPEMLGFVTVGTLTFCLLFACVHAELCSTHLGVAGRWARKKFIIPEYDRAFLPIIWTMLVALGLPLAGYLLGLNSRLCAGATAAISLYVCDATRVDIADWSLTSPARFARRAEQRRQSNQPAAQSLFSESLRR